MKLWFTVAYIYLFSKQNEAFTNTILYVVQNYNKNMNQCHDW